MSDGSSGGGGAADSYIGSLISLTSKSEIRYEGILYTVDTANSNIALQDVRSFGTEGRKKDGPQIPPSDKVYDYIIFRGSDIKDLQVKMSPPVRPVQPQQVHQDPAIISLQSQTSPMVPPSAVSSSASSTTTSTVNASVAPTDAGSYANISSVYQGNASPLYQQQQGGLSSWGMPPMPQANMYWAGYFRPPAGISHFQQQSHLQFQPPGAIPYTAQTQYLPLQQQTLAVPPSTSMSSEMQAAPVLPSSRDTVKTDSLESTTQLAQAPVAQTPSLIEDKVGSSAVAAAAILVSQPLVASTGERGGTAVTTSSPVGLPTSPPADLSKKPGISQVISEPPVLESSMTSEHITASASTSQQQNIINEPLLPLPVNSTRQRQTSEVHVSSTYVRRGRGRGRGAMIQNQFTEDFDFTAMNEKFNKDEVWGELGKGDPRDKGDGEEDATEAYRQEEEDSYRTPVYVKEDFFDTLSSDAYDAGGQEGRMKFSEQRRINAETFGRVSVRSHRGRGGRNGYRGSHRGGHYGSRGVGNGGRGRNYSRSTATY